jgi:hypothetical protein
MSEPLEEMISSMEDEADTLNDSAHVALISDLEDLLKEAKMGLFHDFHRNGADAPKIELVATLDALKDAVISGKYDNATKHGQALLHATV